MGPTMRQNEDGGAQWSKGAHPIAIRERRKKEELKGQIPWPEQGSNELLPPIRPDL